MFDTVRSLREGLEAVVEGLDTDGLDGPRAARLLDDFAAIERLSANAKTLVARRLDETWGWRGEGDRTLAHYVARKTGTSVAHATETVKTAQRLDPWGATADAMKTGDVSAQQASAITEACEADPHAEGDLLATATRDSVEGLRTECRRVKAAAEPDPMTKHRQIHRNRRADAYPGADGAFRVESSLTPEAGAVLWARVEADAGRLACDAKKAGVPVESAAAYRADALVALATDARDAVKVRKVVTVTARVDARPWVTGQVQPGDVCEIDGAGPVPPEVMADFAVDALVYGIVNDGVNLTHMSKLGGEIPAALRRAVLARDRECGVVGCHQRHNLEIDHIQPRARQGPHSIDNLRAACKSHHPLWTYFGWKVGGSHAEGWRLIPPTNVDRAPPDELPLAG